MTLKLLVGLGNPEPRYDMTRHNAGFIVVGRLAIKCGAGFSYSGKMNAELCKIKLAGYDIILARPMTYMNLSGEAVQAITSFYKIEKNDLMVVHDEVALPLGVIRLARACGSAGNHGIESIFDSLGYEDFQRLRIGVGPDPGGAVRAHFVTSKIEEKDLDLFFKAVVLAGDAYEEVLRNGIQVAMNKYNGLDLRPQPDSDAPVLQDKG
jgi:peptidyl-tRNA hydrolase, PTH1 family